MATGSGVRRIFSWGWFGSGSYGGHLYLVFAVCDVISMFPNQRFGEVSWHNNAYFSTSTPLILCSIALNIKLSAVQVKLSEENKLNATTQQFITAKISGWALKLGSETHSSLRQSHLQRQNEAALRSRQIRAVEHWRCASGLAGAHPGLRDRILLNYTRIENAHEVHKKTFVFLWCIEVHMSVPWRERSLP